MSHIVNVIIILEHKSKVAANPGTYTGAQLSGAGELFVRMGFMYALCGALILGHELVIVNPNYKFS